MNYHYQSLDKFYLAIQRPYGAIIISVLRAFVPSWFKILRFPTRHFPTLPDTFLFFPPNKPLQLLAFSKKGANQGKFLVLRCFACPEQCRGTPASGDRPGKWQDELRFKALSAAGLPACGGRTKVFS
jgi:hypothetical protein